MIVASWTGYVGFSLLWASYRLGFASTMGRMGYALVFLLSSAWMAAAVYAVRKLISPLLGPGLVIVTAVVALSMAWVENGRMERLLYMVDASAREEIRTEAHHEIWASLLLVGVASFATLALTGAGAVLNALRPSVPSAETRLL